MCANRDVAPLNREGHVGICGVAVFSFFCNAVNKISTCGVVVISNRAVCDVSVFFTQRCSVK